MFYKVKPKANHAQKLASHADLGREVWVIWDQRAAVYELFASDECSDYVGCADTVEEAKVVARGWFADLQCY